MNEVKVIEYTIDDSGYLGVNCISLVDKPAIEVDFVALKSAKKMNHAAVDEGERRMLYGAVMLPEQLIYRVDAAGGEYYAKYSAETINKIAQEYLKRNMHHNSNHQHEIPITGCTVVENLRFIHRSIIRVDEKLDRHLESHANDYGRVPE